jgi:hypothetical protein
VHPDASGNDASDIYTYARQLWVCQVNGVAGGLILFSACRQAAIEGDVEGVEGLSTDWSKLAALAGRVEAADDQIQAFERGLFVGEVPTGLDGSAEPCVEAFDGVGRADDRADLRIEVEERCEL